MGLSNAHVQDIGLKDRCSRFDHSLCSANGRYWRGTAIQNSRIVAASYFPPRPLARPRRSGLPRKDYAIPIFADLISDRRRPHPNEPRAQR